MRLGVGVGWHEDEFRFMGVEFRGRGRRADEAIEVMKALWGGAASFAGEYWQFEEASFAPLPARQPEIWVGGVNDAAIRRVRKLGDVWHPSSNVDPQFLRDVVAENPDLRWVPRTTPDRVEELLELGAEGVAVMFPDVPSMRTFIARYR